MVYGIRYEKRLRESDGNPNLVTINLSSVAIIPHIRTLVNQNLRFRQKMRPNCAPKMAVCTYWALRAAQTRGISPPFCAQSAVTNGDSPWVTVGYRGPRTQAKAPGLVMTNTANLPPPRPPIQSEFVQYQRKT